MPALQRKGGERATGPETGPTSFNCCACGPDGHSSSVSKHFAVIWIRNSDFECGRSERKSSATEAGFDNHDDMFEFVGRMGALFSKLCSVGCVSVCPEYFLGYYSQPTVFLLVQHPYTDGRPFQDLCNAFVPLSNDSVGF